MERAQRRRPGIVTGRTMSSQPGSPVGLYHNVCGTLNGRSLSDGSMLYGCTCNLSVDLTKVQQDFDMTFTEVGPPLHNLDFIDFVLAARCRHDSRRDLDLTRGLSVSATPHRLTCSRAFHEM